MGNAAAGLPFDSGASIDYNGNWQLNNGNRKDDTKDEKDEVVIFKILKTQPQDRLNPAHRCVQKLRTIKHPNILQYIESVDFEAAVVLVTEPCIPLDVWLKDQAKLCSSEDDRNALFNEIMWGFKCILHGLAFLHTTCNISHSYMGAGIFVCKSGDWKIGALDLAGNLSNLVDRQFLKTSFALLDEIDKLNGSLSPELKQIGKTSSVDSFDASLVSIQGTSDIYSLAKVLHSAAERISYPLPSSITKYTQKMLSTEPKRRPTAAQILKYPMFNTEHIQLLSELGELALKTPTESTEILTKLSSRIADIPRSVCTHKILPSVGRALQMAVNDFSNRDSREACRQSVQLSLSLLSQMVNDKKVDKAHFNSKVLPVIVSLWSMSDRAVRTTLLKTLKVMIELIPEGVVNKSIFDPMLSGFADSNAKMREETLKNLVHVVEKLDERNLQDKLVRAISGLQGDAEASIRTNSTIFLGRVAARLKDGVRVRVLCPSFCKAMRDSFVHCRVAGLKACIACISFLDVSQLATKVLPQVCALVLDRSREVRELSLSLLESSIAILRDNNAKLTAAEALAAANKTTEASGDKEKQAAAASTSGSAGWAASFGSWAVEGLSKSLEKAATVSGADDAPAPSGSAQIKPAPGSGSGLGGGIESLSVKPPASVQRAVSDSSVGSQGSGSSSWGNINSTDMGADSGWGDLDDAFDDDDDVSGKAAKTSKLAQPEKDDFDNWGDSDIDLDDDDDQPAAKAVTKPATSATGKPPSGSGSGMIGGLSALSTKTSMKPTTITTLKKVDSFDDDDEAFAAIPMKVGSKLGEQQPPVASSATGLEKAKMGGLGSLGAAKTTTATKAPPPQVKKLSKDSFDDDDDAFASIPIKVGSKLGEQQTTSSTTSAAGGSEKSKIGSMGGASLTKIAAPPSAVPTPAPAPATASATSSTVPGSATKTKAAQKKVAVSKLAVSKDENWDDF